MKRRWDLVAPVFGMNVIAGYAHENEQGVIVARLVALPINLAAWDGRVEFIERTATADEEEERT